MPRRASPVAATAPSTPVPSGIRNAARSGSGTSHAPVRPSAHHGTSVRSAGSISSTVPARAPVAERRRLQDHLQDAVAGRGCWTASRRGWPDDAASWSRLAVRASTYSCSSWVIRLNVPASRPSSSLRSTGTRVSRSPAATRSAAQARSASGRVVERASQRATSTAPTATASTAPSSSRYRVDGLAHGDRHRQWQRLTGTGRDAADIAVAVVGARLRAPGSERHLGLRRGCDGALGGRGRAVVIGQQRDLSAAGHGQPMRPSRRPASARPLTVTRRAGAGPMSDDPARLAALRPDRRARPASACRRPRSTTDGASPRFTNWRPRPGRRPARGDSSATACNCRQKASIAVRTARRHDRAARSPGPGSRWHGHADEEGPSRTGPSTTARKAVVSRPRSVNVPPEWPLPGAMLT